MRKRIILPMLSSMLLLLCAIVVIIVTRATTPVYANKDYTETEYIDIADHDFDKDHYYYSISTAEGFKKFLKINDEQYQEMSDPSKVVFKVTADISGFNNEELSDTVDSFPGTLDGYEAATGTIHSISGFGIDSVAGEDACIIRNLYGTVSNLKFADVKCLSKLATSNTAIDGEGKTYNNITGNGTCSLINRIDNKGQLIDCTFDNFSMIESSVKSVFSEASVVNSSHGIIRGCTVTGSKFYANSKVAGLVCNVDGGYVENNTVTGVDLKGLALVGGVVADAYGNTLDTYIINNTVNYSNILQFGMNEIEQSFFGKFWDTTGTTEEAYLGGVVGKATNCQILANVFWGSVSEYNIQCEIGYYLAGGIVAYPNDTVLVMYNVFRGCIELPNAYLAGEALQGRLLSKANYTDPAYITTYSIKRDWLGEANIGVYFANDVVASNYYYVVQGDDSDKTNSSKINISYSISSDTNYNNQKTIVWDSDQSKFRQLNQDGSTSTDIFCKWDAGSKNYETYQAIGGDGGGDSLYPYQNLANGRLRIPYYDETSDTVIFDNVTVKAFAVKVSSTKTMAELKSVDFLRLSSSVEVYTPFEADDSLKNHSYFVYNDLWSDKLVYVELYGGHTTNPDYENKIVMESTYIWLNDVYTGELKPLAYAYGSNNDSAMTYYSRLSTIESGSSNGKHVRISEISFEFTNLTYQDNPEMLEFYKDFIPLKNIKLKYFRASGAQGDGGMYSFSEMEIVSDSIEIPFSTSDDNPQCVTVTVDGVENDNNGAFYQCNYDGVIAFSVPFYMTISSRTFEADFSFIAKDEVVSVKDLGYNPFVVSPTAPYSGEKFKYYTGDKSISDSDSNAIYDPNYSISIGNVTENAVSLSYFNYGNSYLYVNSPKIVDGVIQASGEYDFVDFDLNDSDSTDVYRLNMFQTQISNTTHFEWFDNDFWIVHKSIFSDGSFYSTEVTEGPQGIVYNYTISGVKNSSIYDPAYRVNLEKVGNMKYEYSEDNKTAYIKIVSLAYYLGKGGGFTIEYTEGEITCDLTYVFSFLDDTINNVANASNSSDMTTITKTYKHGAKIEPLFSAGDNAKIYYNTDSDRITINNVDCLVVETRYGDGFLNVVPDKITSDLTVSVFVVPLTSCFAYGEISEFTLDGNPVTSDMIECFNLYGASGGEAVLASQTLTDYYIHYDDTTKRLVGYYNYDGGTNYLYVYIKGYGYCYLSYVGLLPTFEDDSKTVEWNLYSITQKEESVEGLYVDQNKRVVCHDNYSVTITVTCTEEGYEPYSSGLTFEEDPDNDQLYTATISSVTSTIVYSLSKLKKSYKLVTYVSETAYAENYATDKAAGFPGGANYTVKNVRYAENVYNYWEAKPTAPGGQIFIYWQSRALDDGTVLKSSFYNEMPAENVVVYPVFRTAGKLQFKFSAYSYDGNGNPAALTDSAFIFGLFTNAIPGSIPAAVQVTCEPTVVSIGDNKYEVTMLYSQVEGTDESDYWVQIQFEGNDWYPYLSTNYISEGSEFTYVRIKDKNVLDSSLVTSDFTSKYIRVGDKLKITYTVADGYKITNADSDHQIYNNILNLGTINLDDFNDKKYYLDLSVSQISYKIEYYIDGVLVHTAENLHLGDPVTMYTPDDPNGYFKGWDTNIDTMPAEDLVINGIMIRNRVGELHISSNVNSLKVFVESSSGVKNYLTAKSKLTYDLSMTELDKLGFIDPVTGDYRYIYVDFEKSGNLNVKLYNISNAYNTPNLSISGLGYNALNAKGNIELVVSAATGYSFETSYSSTKKIVLSNVTSNMQLDIKEIHNEYSINYYVNGVLVHTDNHHYYNDDIVMWVYDGTEPFLYWSETITKMPATNVNIYAMREVFYQIVENPTISDIHENEALGSVLITDGVMNIDGALGYGHFEFKNPDTIVTKADSNTTEFDVVFIPDAKDIVPYNFKMKVTVCNPKYSGEIVEPKLVERTSGTITMNFDAGQEISFDGKNFFKLNNTTYKRTGLRPSEDLTVYYRYAKTNTTCASDIYKKVFTTMSLDEELYLQKQEEAYEKLDNIRITVDNEAIRLLIARYKSKISASYQDSSSIAALNNLVAYAVSVLQSALDIELARTGLNNLNSARIQGYCDAKINEIIDLISQNVSSTTIARYSEYVQGVFKTTDTLVGTFKVLYKDLLGITKYTADGDSSAMSESVYVISKVDELLDYDYNSYTNIDLEDFKDGFVTKTVSLMSSVSSTIHNCDGTQTIAKVNEKLAKIQTKTYLDYKFDRAAYDAEFYLAAEAAIIAHLQTVVLNMIDKEYELKSYGIKDLSKLSLLKACYDSLIEEYSDFDKFTEKYYANIGTDGSVSYQDLVDMFQDQISSSLYIPITAKLSDVEIIIIFVFSASVLGCLIAVVVRSVLRKRGLKYATGRK